MTKREQIMRLAEFDIKEHQIMMESYPFSYNKERAHGRLDENTRLKPLITAMAERIETLEAALEFYAAEKGNRFRTEWDEIGDKWGTTCTFDWGGDFADEAWEIARQALTTKGPLEELLEEEK